MIQMWVTLESLYGEIPMFTPVTNYEYPELEIWIVQNF